MKNSIIIALVAVVLLGNGAIASLRLDAVNQIDDVNSRITALESSNGAIQNSLASLSSENEQMSSASADLQSLLQGMNGGSSSTTPRYGALIADLDPVTVRFTATGGLRGYGSGVIVSSNGYILSVLHSVTGTSNIRVFLNTGEEFPATVVAEDGGANLVLLKLTTTRTDLPVADFGSIADLTPGQTVMAAGYPLILELPGPATFTVGVVSSLRTEADFNFIQSDADIAQGSGGGGLFTMDGNLVGIAANAQADGIYEFIPIDLAASLLENIPS